MINEHITKIGNTPLSISVYAVKDKAIHMHDAGMLEIIFCLTGTVKFSYAYEEFTLNAGEYVSVDRDAYYLHSDGYNMCVSFYVDLMAFEKNTLILNIKCSCAKGAGRQLPSILQCTMTD